MGLPLGAESTRGNRAQPMCFVVPCTAGVCLNHNLNSSPSISNSVSLIFDQSFSFQLFPSLKPSIHPLRLAPSGLAQLPTSPGSKRNKMDTQKYVVKVCNSISSV